MVILRRNSLHPRTKKGGGDTHITSFVQAEKEKKAPPLSTRRARKGRGKGASPLKLSPREGERKEGRSSQPPEDPPRGKGERSLSSSTTYESIEEKKEEKETTFLFISRIKKRGRSGMVFIRRRGVRVGGPTVTTDPSVLADHLLEQRFS